MRHRPRGGVFQEHERIDGVCIWPVVEPTRLVSSRPRHGGTNKKALPGGKAFLIFGGGGGIRTHEARESLPVFKTGAIDHSATPPRPRSLAWMAGVAEGAGVSPSEAAGRGASQTAWCRSGP